MKIGDQEYPSLKGKVSEEEWRTRVELAALYRLVPLMGWDDLSFTMISARVPGEPHYLFNPLGFLFEEITASSLVKIDMQGKIVSDTPFQITVDGWYPMKAVHAVREDASFVMHTHAVHGIALSTRRELLQPITQDSAFVFADKLAYHEYEGVETYEQHIPTLQRSLGDANRMILRNHGLLTLGLTSYHVFVRMYQLIRTCQVQLLAGKSEDVTHVDQKIIDAFPVELARAALGNNPWPGLLRKLDRLDPTYKD